MREGNRLGVSGGASLHGPMRRPRGVGRGLRWIVCSVIAGQLAGVPPLRVGIARAGKPRNRGSVPRAPVYAAGRRAPPANHGRGVPRG